MKKFLFIFFVLIANSICFFSLISGNVYAYADSQNKKYAQIIDDYTYFYTNDLKQLFLLPKTYYVELLQDANESGFYYAKYINIKGFVNKNDVQCVSSQPTNPFLDNINFRTLASQSCELRNEPYRTLGTKTLIYELDLYETNFIYYGSITGEEVVPKLSNIWYYCSYTKNNTEYFGYIYSGLTDQFTNYINLPIDSNTIEHHNWNNNEIVDPQTETIEPVSSEQLAIIICISIPILLLLIALMKPSQRTKVIKNGDKSSEKEYEKVKNRHKIINMPKAKRNNVPQKGKDYYEL